MPPLMRAADVFAFPSSARASAVVLEAQAAGLLVVVRPPRAPRVPPRRPGLSLVPVGDAEALGAASSSVRDPDVPLRDSIDPVRAATAARFPWDAAADARAGLRASRSGSR